MKTAPTLLILATLLLQGISYAQENSVEGNAALPTRSPQFRCTLPGGTYAVAVSAITSVSIHEYIVDGAARVFEVNIDTSGKTQVRFYYLEPITPQSPIVVGQAAIDRMQDLAKEALGRTNQDEVWKRVSKTYPGSTHAHTVEYRLQSLEELRRIYKDADEAFRLQINKTLKL